MGMILPPRRVSADSSGNGRNGAKLRIYNANTTTLASVYSDAALTVPLTNPVVANSSGVFPPIYAAEALYDVTEQTSAGATIYSEDDVPGIGISSGVFLRDFTNSRARIAGSGGVVSYEGGDPTGDDVGGKVRLGGYNDTQAVTAEIDAAATSVTGTLDVTGNMTTGGTVDTGGLLTEDGKDMLGIVYTDATPFSAVASVEITLPNSPTGVTSYEIYIYDFSMSAAANLQATMSFDGSTYKTGASDYAFVADSTISSASISRDNAEAFGLVLSSAEIATGKKGVLRIRVQTTATSGDPTIIWGEWVGQFLNGGLYYGGKATFSISYVGGLTTRIMKLKLAPASGNISGTYKVVPLRGTGD